MPSHRSLRVIAKDPTFCWPAGTAKAGEIVTYTVEVPYEDLDDGPRGSRVHVIDYLTESGALLTPASGWENSRGHGPVDDPFVNATTEDLISNPAFHAQNVYGLVSMTLARFEFALGRRMEWGFGGHQLKVVPHAFADANAFYSSKEQTLAFGHFPALSGDGSVFTCLSHDIVVHETAHALLDGLRKRLTVPSGPDQAAIHEAFADLIALLSVLATGNVVNAALSQPHEGWTTRHSNSLRRGLLHHTKATAKGLRSTVLGSVAQQIGAELYGRGNALRASANLEPPVDLNSGYYMEEHNRGEVLVAAMMSGYFEVLANRLETLGYVDYLGEKYVDLGRAVEEAADIADYLLTMLIRGIDYAPPIHLSFGDFLSALLTADFEVRPDDSRYSFRATLIKNCAAFSIGPAAKPGGPAPGCWAGPSFTPDMGGLRFDSFRTDPAEVMRFVWANRGPDQLALHPTAYTAIESVRPSVRIAPDDGFPLRETIAECVQIIGLTAQDLEKHGVQAPADMSTQTQLQLLGGTTLIFDEFGRLKYDIHNHLPTLRIGTVGARTTKRLRFLHSRGAFGKGRSVRRQLASLHLNRSLGMRQSVEEEW